MYRERREAAFVVAVQCARAGGTCFCASMGTGPAPTGHYDIALTEMQDGFLARAGSDAGRDLLAALSLAVMPLLARAKPLR